MHEQENRIREAIQEGDRLLAQAKNWEPELPEIDREDVRFLLAEIDRLRSELVRND